MIGDGLDLREYQRINGMHIPQQFEQFIIDPGIGSLLEGRTSDFTVKGVRINIETTPSFFQVDENIIIKTKDANLRLIGNIRHIIKYQEKSIYLGVLFLRTRSLAEYTKIVEEEGIS